MKSKMLIVIVLAVGSALLPIGSAPPASAALTYTQVSSGGEHACALVSGGVAQCWGENYFGALGNGTKRDSSVPVTVRGIADATQISSGYYHTCALLPGGAVKCWGLNGEGELGDGTTEDSKVPVDVSGITGATRISADGGWHTCALLPGGAVKCWGNNDYGQLGNGSWASSSVPVDVSAIADATQVSVGGRHTCALVSGGAVKCWGHNGSGELGDGTWTDSSTPVRASGITGATQISAGVAHTCALVSGSDVTCWGLNRRGQLGNGTTTDSSIPVDVVAGTALSISAPALGILGTKARIIGALSSLDPACVSSQQVTLEKDGSKAAIATTDATGAYRFVLKIAGKTVVRVAYVGNASCGPSASVKKTIRVN